MTTTVNTINGNEGNNRLTGTSRNDVINGNGGNDKLSGGLGDDTLNGGAGKDELNGGSGNDVLDGGSGSDELEGGSGNDTLIYTLAENNVIGKWTYDEYEGGSGTDTLELRFTRAEWMNEDNQKMLQSYLKWASKSDSSCRWDDDFTFRFGNARLEIEDIEKLVVKVDDAEIKDVGKKKNVDAVNDTPNSITEDETAVQSIYVLSNDSVDNLVKNLELVSSTTNGTVKLVKPESTKDNAYTWYFEYTPDSTVYQSLNAGEFREETFTYRVTDADGDQDTAEVKITITGINDAAIISGKTSGSVTENGSDSNGDSNNNGGSPTETGHLFSSISNNGNPFNSITSQITTYGEFSITSQGSWTYTLDNKKKAVNELNVGSPGKESITVYAADNTEQIITINITGANDTAIIGDPPINQLREDTNVNFGSLNLTSSLSINDIDNDSRFISGVFISQARLGELNFIEGQYIYYIQNFKIQFLSEGQQLTDSYTVKAVDGTPKTISFTITGVNDAAVIAGEVTGVVTESGSSSDGGLSTTTGQLTINDIDNFENSFEAEENKTTTYGKFSITSQGSWTYLLNNDNETINKLNSNSEALKDTFTIKSIDGTPQIITITINGANDAAVIGGTTTGSVTEDDSSFDDGRPKATGSLTASDIDNESNIFQVVTDQESIYGYGTYSITKDGMWTYSLFNNIDGVGEVEVNSGDTVQDSFTFTSFDGTPQIITITINGADREVISDPEITEVKEDEGVTDFGTIDLEGKLTINVGTTQLVDPFKEEVTFSPDNIGSINFATDGSYKYSINNNNIQFLDEEKPHYDYFNVFSKSGSIKTLVFNVIGVNDMPVVKEIGQGENKYAGSANVEELINLYYKNPDIAAKAALGGDYDYLHVRTGQFLVSDVDVGDQLTVSNKPTNPDEKIGNLSTVILQLKDSEGNPIGGKYVVNWTYTVKDSELDPLNKGVDGKPTKDQKFTVTIGDGTATVDTEVVLHLFGRDEIEFVGGYDDGNNVYVDPNGSSGASSTGGNDVLYLGDGDDSFISSASSVQLIYGEDGDDRSALNNGSHLVFGGNGNDFINLGRILIQGLAFGGDGNDDFILAGKISTTQPNVTRESFMWGGEGTDVFEQSVLSTTQINDWIMDFDGSNPNNGGDKIEFVDISRLDATRLVLTPHVWKNDVNKTQLIQHQADSLHPFLSEGSIYYELQAKSSVNLTDTNWYSVLNLVGTNGTAITLDGLFANGNLNPIEIL